MGDEIGGTAMGREVGRFYKVINLREQELVTSISNPLPERSICKCMCVLLLSSPSHLKQFLRSVWPVGEENDHGVNHQDVHHGRLAARPLDAHLRTARRRRKLVLYSHRH